MSVTAVAFDFGGVLTHTAFGGLGAYEQELGLPPDAIVRHFRDGLEMSRLEIGQITAKQFFKGVCVEVERAHGQRLDIHRLAASAAEGERLNSAMIELVAEVGQHCSTALLTNNVAEASWRASFPFDLFTVVIDSSEVGVRKPDPAIYAKLLRRLDRRPEQVAFVDDLSRNVDAASALGIHPILFTNEQSCRAALSRIGALGRVTGHAR